MVKGEGVGWGTKQKGKKKDRWGTTKATSSRRR